MCEKSAEGNPSRFQCLAVKEYTDHYHVERNPQGVDNELIDDQRSTTPMISGIKRRERPGGMLNYYHRRAA
jgi:hypothetical protein